MSTPSSITGLIDQWDTIKEFADDIGCGYEAARQMRRRNSAARWHWGRIIDACKRKGIPGVDYTWLATLEPSCEGSEATHAA